MPPGSTEARVCKELGEGVAKFLVGEKPPEETEADEGTLQYYLPLGSRVSVHARDQQESGPGGSQGEVSIDQDGIFIPPRGREITTGTPSGLAPRSPVEP